MYRNKQVPNLHPAKLVVTTVRMAVCHFKSAADKAKALSDLTTEQRQQAQTPVGLAKLVKDKIVQERYVHRLLVKMGGLTRLREPKEVTTKAPVSLKLGQPFLTSDDGAVTLHGLTQVNPQGFRQPSRKAKKWRSTSLMEIVTGVKPEFVRSKRGDKKAIADAEHRELVKATQDVRNVADRYLSASQRRLKASLPPLPKAETLEAIRERHARAHPDEEKIAA